MDTVGSYSLVAVAMNRYDKIFITGHRGLVGSALVRELQTQGYENLYTVSREDVDLTDPVQVKWYFSCIKPEWVFHCAARVGGIKDNIAHPLEFLRENSIIQENVLHNASEYWVKKLLFLGSSCIYPRDCPQPIKEEYLLTGPFEKAVEAYGLAKVGGVKLCEYYRQELGCNFIAAMPCNVFGPSDNFDPQTAHIVPGLIARMHAAKVAGEPEFKVWGDGSARRELIYSDDLAKALILIMQTYDGPGHINAGSGLEYSVAEIAQLVRVVVGYAGALVPEQSEPTGTPRKIMDNSKLKALGWGPSFCIVDALRRTYADFLKKSS